MFVALLLTTMLAGPAGGGQATQIPTQAEAEAMAQQGKPEAALDAFRKRAAANPKDVAARLSIARLHEQMGHPELAEPVYRSVMLEAPDNVDAMIGVGTTLVSLERGDEALLILDRAVKLAPKNAGLLAALGAAHLQAANIKLGLSYLELAVSIDPSPANHRALEQARRTYGHHIVASGVLEQFNGGVSDTGSGNLVVDYRLLDTFRVMARGQYQRKFGFSDQRGGAGFEWRPQPRTAIIVQALVGPDNDILPETDAFVQIRQSSRRAGVSVGYRYADFQGAHVSVITPGAEWLGPKASLAFSYSLATTTLEGFSDAVYGHSATVDGRYRLQPRFWIRLGYAYGVENFDSLSPDRLGNFKAHTARGGLRIDMATATSLFGLYEYQQRPGDIKMNRVSVSLSQSF